MTRATDYYIYRLYRNGKSAWPGVYVGKVDSATWDKFIDWIREWQDLLDDAQVRDAAGASPANGALPAGNVKNAPSNANVTEQGAQVPVEGM